MKMMHDPGAGGPTVLQWHDVRSLLVPSESMYE